MAHIGHPVMGDPLYGTGFRTKAKLLPEAAREALAALGRQALHAAVLGFAHPRTGEELGFVSPLPPELAALERALDRAAS
jgi:23S rRNA pseudouridine1911/1915/1917 synthase